MRETIYIIFNRNGYIKTVKTLPAGGDFITLNIVIDDKYFDKQDLEATLNIDENADLTVEYFEMELKRLKKE